MASDILCCTILGGSSTGISIDSTDALQAIYPNLDLYVALFDAFQPFSKLDYHLSYELR